MLSTDLEKGKTVRYFPKFRKHSGFSLVEVLFSLGAISVLVTGAASFFNSRMKEQRILSIQNSKSIIINSLENSVTDPLILKASYEITNGPYGSNNQKFNSCLFGTCPKAYLSPPSWDASGSLNAASNNQILGLNSSDGNGTYSILSGKWSESGVNNCLAQDFLSCPYFVRVFFWFQCDSAPSSKLSNGDCLETTQVYLMFQLLPSDPMEAKRRGLRLYHPGNSDKIAAPSNYAYVMSASELRGLIRQDCPTNQYLESYDSKGRARCSCLNNKDTIKDAAGNEILDALGRPQCQASDVCPSGQFLKGYSQPDVVTGVTSPICVPFASQSASCMVVKLGSTMTDCPAGYAVTQIDYGECDIKNVGTKKKGEIAQNEVVCSNDSVTCCPRVQ